MNQAWPEGNGTYAGWGTSGPSWRCANDTDTSVLGNLVNNCTNPNKWGMESTDPDPVPYTASASDSVALYSNGSVTVRFDVTADVQAILSTGTNHGWLVKAAGDALTGSYVHFGSRETLSGPRLILDIGSDLCGSDPAKTAPGQCGCGTPDTDTDGDKIADCLEPVLLPVADTTLRLLLPYGNDGMGVNLGVTAASIAPLERTLLRFDQEEIIEAVQGLEVRSARIDLSVTGIAVGWGGGALELFAMNRSWPEGTGTDTALGAHGPSWTCADDTNTANTSNNCGSGDAWGMHPIDPDPLPFNATASDAAVLTTGVTTTVSFDVTSDVRAFLQGTQNHGWMIKGTTDLLSGNWVNFGSRETSNPPKLVLELGRSGPPPSSFNAPLGHPDVGCTQYQEDSVNYFVCDERRTYDVAERNCERVGMKLASVESSTEDAWLGSVISQPVWLGASERDTPGTWAWDRDGTVFWDTGNPVSGVYANWENDDPDSGADGPCAYKASTGAEEWATERCYQYQGYVCEGEDTDAAVKYVSLVTQYIMCRVGRNQAESDLELEVQAAMAGLPGVATSLDWLEEEKCDDLAAICSNVDTQLMLGALAEFDPCTQTGPVSKADLRKATSRVLASTTIRDDMCVTADRDITVNYKVLSELTLDDELGTVISSAAPWIVGVDPTHFDGFFGDDILARHWNLQRSDPLNSSDTGDGLSPFGVLSEDSTGAPLPCSSCVEALGQMCGTVLGLQPNCYSFPVVTHQSELRLLGYNFWDSSEAVIGFERVADPGHRFTTSEVNIVAADDCDRPTADPRELFDEPADQAIARVPVDGGYFYRVRIFNKNGTYHTGFDNPGTQSTSDRGRTIHTCWSGCNPATHACPTECDDPDDLECAVLDCTPPSGQTCEMDGLLPGAACAEWGTAPRKLTKLDQYDQPFCYHDVWDAPPARKHRGGSDRTRRWMTRSCTCRPGRRCTNTSRS